jgi:rare lipoprotein A
MRGVIALAGLCAAMHAQTAERGLASWYGAPYDGQQAANGSLYRQEEFTAAHRTLPFGTAVRVRRTDNGASVVVLISDRGPFVDSRVVDVSFAAARKLGMLESGVAPVALEILEQRQAVGVNTPALYAVQAASFRLQANAERTRALLERLHPSARVLAVPVDGLWRVLVGALSDPADAESLASAVRKSAKAFEAAFVVRLSPGALSVSD